MRAEFGHNPPSMKVHGLHRDVQQVSRSPCSPGPRQPVAALRSGGTSRTRRARARLRRDACTLSTTSRSNDGRDVHLPFEDLLHRDSQLFIGGGLEHVTRPTRVHRFPEIYRTAMHAQEQQLHFRPPLLDLPGGVDPVHHGHGNVENDQVRPQPQRGLHQRPAIPHLPDYVVVSVQQTPRFRPQSGRGRRPAGCGSACSTQLQRKRHRHLRTLARLRPDVDVPAHQRHARLPY